MTNITNIKTEFDQFIPMLKADYVDSINRQFDAFEKEHGPVGTLSRHGCPYAVERQMYLRQFGSFADGKCYGRPDSPYVRNPAKIEKFCQEAAESNVQSYVAKLEKKLGDMEDVAIIDVRDGSFTITGRLGNSKVVVNQTIVMKFSNRGTPYHQFPARIYVDGKFTPEKNFKKMAAA